MERTAARKATKYKSELPGYLPRQAKDFIMKLLQKNPKGHLGAWIFGFKDIKEHESLRLLTGSKQH
jgi:hypothetical protein